MKRILVAAALLSASFASAAMAQDLIAQATSPLPDALKASATVINYDAKGNPTVLRQGTGVLVCVPDQPTEGFSVNCFNKALRAQNDMSAKLRAEGKDAKAIQAALAEARTAGKLPLAPMGAMRYSRSGKTEADARTTWVISLPNMTGEMLGVPDKKGPPGLPWLQAAGTPGAHLHISNGVPTAAAPM